MRRLVAAFVSLAILTAPAARASDCPSAAPDAWPEVADAILRAAAIGCAPSEPPSDAAAETLRSLGGSQARLDAITVELEVDGRKTPWTLWRVQTGDSIRIVEPDGRTYRSWDDWRRNNRLPAGWISAPLGTESRGADCSGPRERFRTPAGTFLGRATMAMDIGAGVGGAALAVATIAGTGGTALVVGGLALSAYGLVRSATRLYDRAVHRQTLNPVSSGEARGAWIGLVAGATTFGSLGAWLSGAQEALGALRTAGSVLAVTSFTHAGVETVRAWPTLDGPQRALQVAQLAFWGSVTAIQLGLFPKPLHENVRPFAERSEANGARWRAEVENAARDAGLGREGIERVGDEVDRGLRVEIRTGSKGLLGFLRDGTYKIAGEVESNGRVGAGREYVEFVRKTEAAQGYAGQRVIYGSLAWDGESGQALTQPLSRYGEVVLRLRNENVASRVVLTGEDSLNYHVAPSAPTTRFDQDVATWNQARDLAMHHALVRQPELRAITAANPGYRHYGLYPEARIVGGLTPADVEAILLPASPSWDGVAAQAAALARGTGIEVHRIPAEMPSPPAPSPWH